MGLRINTNVQSLAAQRHFSSNHYSQSRLQAQLSSGSRIPSAGDDAAGLSISEGLRSHLVSLRQSTRNTGDGISLIQVAEGAMNETSGILIRLRELSIQAASDTIGDTERKFIDKEVQHLKAEIERISLSTQFNGRRLLQGEGEAIEVQVGYRNREDVDRLAIRPVEFAMSNSILGVEGVHTQSRTAAQQSLSALDDALVKLNDKRSNLGAFQNRQLSIIRFSQIHHENLSASRSRIYDVDLALASSELMRDKIMTSSNLAAMVQANQGPSMALQLLS